MENSFGKIFKDILLEREISKYKLSKETGVSKTHLSRIENNTNEPSIYILNKLSKFLLIDLGNCYKIYSDFNSIKEYEDFLILRELIEYTDEPESINEIEDFVRRIKLNYIKSETYKQVINYAKALVEANKYKRYDKSLDYCFKSISKLESLFNPKRIEKYVTSEVSFCVLTLIEYNYFALSRLDDALEVSLNLIMFIEKLYFNESILKTDMPKMIFRSYVTLLNNIADTLYTYNEFSKSIKYCEKGIEILYKEKSFYAMSYLYEILGQNFYGLEKFEKSQEYFEKAKCYCIAVNDIEHLSRIKMNIAENYPQITNFM